MDLLASLLWILAVYVVVKFVQNFLIGYLKQKGFLTADILGNPFLHDPVLPLKPKVTDQKARDAVLKQNFKVEKIPEDLDAIVIGSGIGGLSTAALLSKVGKKVLVLEQHDQAGGSCHTFIEKGYEFDVGIHYIGEMHFQSLTKTYLDQISEGQIQWEKLDEEFDTVVFKVGNDKLKKYPIVSEVEKQKRLLKNEFPDESKAIDKYYDLVGEINKTLTSSMYVKFLPLFLVKLLDRFNIIHWLTNYFTWNRKTVKEVLQDLTSNQRLRDIFCYCFGDYGTVPSEAGFPMQAILTAHFSEGAAYPIGGASEIAFNIIPVIEKSGGKVLVRAEVTDILFGSSNEAKGVKVRHGKQDYEIFAPRIISNAGLRNTFDKFLPKEISSQSRLYPLVKEKHGVGALSIFVGFDAPAEALEVATKKNYWVFTKDNIDQAAVDYLAVSKEECENLDVPLMFISFPSTKDPSWENRYPGKTTMAIVTLSNYDWFSDWEKDPCQRRGDEYDAVKKTIGWKAINHACDIFPKLKDHIDYVSIGSPLSNCFYLGSPKGEIYGLDHTQNRFSVMNNALLRPATDIAGLYLTGQDVCSCGFTGALWGGLLCAQQVLGRNIMSDLTTLYKEEKLKNKKEH